MAKLTGTGVSGSDIFCTARVKSYPGVAVRPWSAIRPSSAAPAGGGPPGCPGQGVQGQGRRPRRGPGRPPRPGPGAGHCPVHPFRWFVTLTLDPARVNRYDVREVTRHLNHWLDNQVRRKGPGLRPGAGRHKDGAIHFHGFFNDALEARDSGTVSLPGQKAPRRPRSARQRAKWLEDGGNPSTTFPAGLGASRRP